MKGPNRVFGSTSSGRMKEELRVEPLQVVVSSTSGRRCMGVCLKDKVVMFHGQSWVLKRDDTKRVTP